MNKIFWKKYVGNIHYLQKKTLGKKRTYWRTNLSEKKKPGGKKKGPVEKETSRKKNPIVKKY